MIVLFHCVVYGGTTETEGKIKDVGLHASNVKRYALNHRFMFVVHVC